MVNAVRNVSATLDVMMTMLRPICQCALVAKCAGQFRNRVCAIAKFLPKFNSYPTSSQIVQRILHAAGRLTDCAE